MESKEITIKKNNAKIDELRIEYNDIMSRLSSIKSIDLFHIENNKALSISNKIDEIKKKSKFIENGLPSNGYSDHHEDFNFLE